MQDNKGITKFRTNHRLLICCLFSLVLLGTAYHIDNRKEMRESVLVLGTIVWYVTLGFVIIFVFKKIRLGYLLAGIISWSTLVFCLVDNWYTVFQVSVIVTKPNLSITTRNFIGVGIATLGIISSHNAFHKVCHAQKK